MPSITKADKFQSIQTLIATQLTKAHREAQKRPLDVAMPIDDKLAAVPNEYKPFDAMDLYQRLVMSNLDIKGNMASCYGNYGDGIIATAKVDFAKFFCPFLSSISLAGGITAKHMSSALLVIQRSMPKVFPVGQATYYMPYPVTFLTMSGMKSQVELNFQAGFKFGKKIFEHNQDKPESLVAAALQLELSAALNASQKGVSMHVTDIAPGHYKHWLDDGLKVDFKNTLGNVSSESLKIQTTSYYDYIVGFSIARLSHMGEKDLDPIKKKFAAIAATRNLTDRITKLSDSVVKGKVADALKNYAKEHQGSEVAQKAPTVVEKLWSKVSPTAELKDLDFEDLKELFIEWRKTIHNADHELDNIIAKLEWDIRQLKYAENHPSDATKQSGFFSKIGDKLEMGEYSNRSYLSKMSFLTYTSFNSAYGTGVITNVQANLSIKGKGANAAASANASLKGQLGNSLYRYQTFSNYDAKKSHQFMGSIIYTQDVEITYRQLLADASAGLKISDKFDKKLEKKFIYNQITYSAVQAYWMLLREYHWRPPGDKVNLLPGSGVSYGFSVRPEALSDLCTQIYKFRDSVRTRVSKKRSADDFHEILQRRYKKLTTTFLDSAPKSDQQLLTSIAAALHVTTAQVVEFLDGSSFQEIDNSNLNNVNAIILESNYQITDSKIQMMTETESGGLAKENVVIKEDLLDTIEKAVVKTLPPVAKKPSKMARLASIRIRFRTADYHNAEETKFKLGIPEPIAKKLAPVDLSIEFKEVSEAGIDGIIDVYTYWFPPFRHLFMESDDVLESQTVPPVSLFFQ